MTRVHIVTADEPHLGVHDQPDGADAEAHLQRSARAVQGRLREVTHFDDGRADEAVSPTPR